MNPKGWAGVRGSGQRFLPNGYGGVPVDEVAGALNGPSSVLVVFVQRSRSIAGTRRAVGWQGLQFLDDLREVESERDGVVEPLEGRGLAR